MPDNDIFARADFAAALQEHVPSAHVETFKAHVRACQFEQEADVSPPGSDSAQRVIAGALAKVRAAQGTPDPKDERTRDQIVRDAVLKRFDPSAYSDKTKTGLRTSAIKMQRLMAAVDRELYPDDAKPAIVSDLQARGVMTADGVDMSRLDFLDKLRLAKTGETYKDTSPAPVPRTVETIGAELLEANARGDTRAVRLLSREHAMASAKARANAPPDKRVFLDPEARLRKANNTSSMLRDLDSARRAVRLHGADSTLGKIASDRVAMLEFAIKAAGVRLP